MSPVWSPAATALCGDASSMGCLIQQPVRGTIQL